MVDVMVGLQEFGSWLMCFDVSDGTESVHCMIMQHHCESHDMMCCAVRVMDIFTSMWVDCH